MNDSNKLLGAGWERLLNTEMNKDYFNKLSADLSQMRTDGVIVYPIREMIFNAFKLTPWDQVKGVILGQDPYHSPGVAMGLSFSVPRQVKIPPSLRNIYKELNSDLDCPIPIHGDLTSWADQGVLLLNAMLTVAHKLPGSHGKLGWQQFTDEVISQLSLRKKGLFFMLWGNFAMSKSRLIDDTKHLVLKAKHPSPLARGAFFGCKHFSRANEYLISHGRTTINWQIK